MRSNGLTASAYTPVADLDPTVADSLLDDLKAQGVAAYTKPLGSPTTAGSDRPEIRTSAKDRLFVDAAASSDVRAMLSNRDPDLLTRSDDLTWAQLVAGFDTPLETDVAPWPADEDYLLDARPLVDERDVAARQPPAKTVDEPPARWGSRVEASETTDDDDFLASTSTTRHLEEDDDEHKFIPDPPPPLPTLPPYKQLAWAGLLGGPLLLLLGAIAHVALPGWASGLAIISFIGGFITLVATMGEDSDGDGGQGNGAVV